MKKLTILAIFIAATSTGANAAQVYEQDGFGINVGGRVEARGQYQSEDVHKTNDISRARLHIKVTQDIGKDVDAVGYLEQEYNASGENILPKHMYVGFATENNEIYYGQTDGALELTTDYTDIMNTYGGDGNIKPLTADRAKNSILAISHLGDLTLRTHVNFGGEDGKVLFHEDAHVDSSTGKFVPESTLKQTIDTGYGAAASYEIGAGFGLTGAYAIETYDIGKDSTDGIVGIKWDSESIYLSGIGYDGSDKGDDFKGYETAARFKATNEISFVATYTMLDKDSATENVEHSAIEMNYNFTPNFVTYAAYQEVLNDGTGNTANNAMLGAKLTF
ncbi:porin [Vibrio splendidus]|uniref:porin n=1 Tax=Vibrio splendidus TaxID=29497 RepID=UPI0002EA31AF|nr:porin [Vibrio splendidus]